MKEIRESDIYERYCERAGIMQFDAGFSACRSSQIVFNQVKSWTISNGIPFPESVREDFHSIIKGTHHARRIESCKTS